MLVTAWWNNIIYFKWLNFRYCNSKNIQLNDAKFWKVISKVPNFVFNKKYRKWFFHFMKSLLWKKDILLNLMFISKATRLFQTHPVNNLWDFYVCTLCYQIPTVYIYIQYVLNTLKHRKCIIYFSIIFSGAFYYTLGNIRPEKRSHVNAIQLLALTNSKHVEQYGVDSVLERFLLDLSELEKVHVNTYWKLIL